MFLFLLYLKLPGSLRSRYGYSSWLRLSGMCIEVYQPKRLHELIDINAPILIEVDALGKVCNCFVADLGI